MSSSSPPRSTPRSTSTAALFAPEATHWGTRWFVARDPDGNLIAFEQRQ
jgi:hypothetical protein